jgi:VIT1/CCC1 family predicted Fe2+/Mn2+ transporter
MGVSGIIPVIIRWREQQNQPRPPSPMTSPDPGHAPLARPVIFGLADGMMSLLGVVLYLLGHQALIFPAALSGGISSALSMAGGEWLSDSENGLTASAAMGAATGLGAVLPALPYAFTTGTTAIAESVTICLMIGLCVAFLRPGRSLPVALTETFSILLAIFGVVLLCGLILPGAAA